MRIYEVNATLTFKKGKHVIEKKIHEFTVNRDTQNVIIYRDQSGEVHMDKTNIDKVRSRLSFTTKKGIKQLSGLSWLATLNPPTEDVQERVVDELKSLINEEIGFLKNVLKEIE